MDMNRKMSVYREYLKLCFETLDLMRQGKFYDTSEWEPPLKTDAEKFRAHSILAFTYLREAIPLKGEIWGPKRVSVRQKEFSRRQICEAVTERLKEQSKDRYIITSRKIKHILFEITGGKEQGTSFVRIRENPPEYTYSHGMINQVIKKIKAQGVSTKYLQKQLGLTPKTYNTFIEDLCYKSFNKGASYLPVDSLIAKYFRKSYTWDSEKGKATSKNQLDVGKERVRYRFTYRLCLELEKILAAKNAVVKAEKENREKENNKKKIQNKKSQ